jgi:hypothetical protein
MVVFVYYICLYFFCVNIIVNVNLLYNLIYITYTIIQYNDMATKIKTRTVHKSLELCDADTLSSLATGELPIIVQKYSKYEETLRNYINTIVELSHFSNINENVQVQFKLSIASIMEFYIKLFKNTGKLFKKMDTYLTFAQCTDEERKQVQEHVDIIIKSPISTKILTTRSRLCAFKEVKEINDVNKLFTNGTFTDGLKIFDDVNIDINELWTGCNNNENKQKLCSILLKLYEYSDTYFSLYESPNFDPKTYREFVSNLVSNIGDDKEYSDILNLVKQATDIKADSFNQYYKDYLKTQNPGTFISSYLDDAMNNKSITDKISKTGKFKVKMQIAKLMKKLNTSILSKQIKNKNLEPLINSITKYNSKLSGAINNDFDTEDEKK